MCSTSTTPVALGCPLRRDPKLDEMRCAGFHEGNRVPGAVLVLLSLTLKLNSKNRITLRLKVSAELSAHINNFLLT